MVADPAAYTDEIKCANVSSASDPAPRIIGTAGTNNITSNTHLKGRHGDFKLQQYGSYYYFAATEGSFGTFSRPGNIRRRF